MTMRACGGLPEASESLFLTSKLINDILRPRVRILADRSPVPEVVSMLEPRVSFQFFRQDMLRLDLGEVAAKARLVTVCSGR
jgi:hypothetical protein